MSFNRVFFYRKCNENETKISTFLMQPFTLFGGYSGAAKLDAKKVYFLGMGMSCRHIKKAPEGASLTGER